MSVDNVSLFHTANILFYPKEIKIILLHMLAQAYLAYRSGFVCLFS